MMVYEIKQDESGDYYLWEIELNNNPCGDRHRLVFTSGLLAAVEQRKIELEGFQMTDGAISASAAYQAFKNIGKAK